MTESSGKGGTQSAQVGVGGLPPARQPSTAPTPVTRVVERTNVSQPGATVRVQELRLSESAASSLNTGARRLGNSR